MLILLPRLSIKVC